VSMRMCACVHVCIVCMCLCIKYMRGRQAGVLNTFYSPADKASYSAGAHDAAGAHGAACARLLACTHNPCTDLTVTATLETQ